MPPIAYPELETAVEQSMLEGAPFDGVEDFIEEQELPSDLKSALWLVAWSMQDAGDMRRRARECSAAIAATYD